MRDQFRRIANELEAIASQLRTPFQELKEYELKVTLLEALKAFPDEPAIEIAKDHSTNVGAVIIWWREECEELIAKLEELKPKLKVRAEAEKETIPE